MKKSANILSDGPFLVNSAYASDFYLDYFVLFCEKPDCGQSANSKYLILNIINNTGDSN